MTTLTFWYWIGFGLYSTIVLGMGFYYFKKDKTESNDAFWSAGKQLSGWQSGLSISASMMSISWSCVYGVQLFYWYGVGAIWLLIIPWLITMVGFFVLTPIFRKIEAFSQPELLGKQFGKRSRILLAPALAFVFLVWGGAEIYAAGITIAPFLNISVNTTLVLIAMVVALYSFTGGFAAVVATDKIQFSLVAFFITCMAGIGIYGVFENGLSTQFWEATFTAPKSNQTVPFWLSPGYAIIGMTFLAYLPGWLIETDIWIRMQAAKNIREARKGILIAGLNSFCFVGLMPMLIGLAALLLYPPIDGVIPENLGDGALIFTVLMQDYTPIWLNVILGIGLMAAAMSTVDTCSNVVALSLSYDIIEQSYKSNFSPQQLTKLSRYMSAVAVFLALVYALFTESLWDIFYLSSGILTTTVFIPVIAVFQKNATAKAVNSAMIAGFLATIGAYFAESRGYLSDLLPNALAETQLVYILIGALCSTITYFTMLKMK